MEQGGAHERHRLLPARPRGGRDPPPDQIAVCELRGDLQTKFDARNQGIDVGRSLQEVGLDLERAVGSALFSRR